MSFNLLEQVAFLSSNFRILILESQQPRVEKTESSKRGLGTIASDSKKYVPSQLQSRRDETAFGFGAKMPKRGSFNRHSEYSDSGRRRADEKMTLNFNRFTYRRKPALDFLSSNRNSGKGSSQNSGSSTQRNLDEKVSNNEVKTTRKDLASPRPTLFAPVNDGAAQRNTPRSNINQRNKAETRRTESYFEKKGRHEGSGEKCYNTKENQSISAEEKLRNLLSSGPQCSTSFQLNEKPNREERQEIVNNNETELTGAHCNKAADTKEKSLFVIKQGERSIDGYQNFKQRVKRKRRVILSDDDDDNDVNDDGDFANEKISTIEQSCKRERHDKNRPQEDESPGLTTDIDKLREIYSHLTIDQAKEAIALAGSLMDAILNLSETLFAEEKKLAESKSKTEYDEKSVTSSEAGKNSEAAIKTKSFDEQNLPIIEDYMAKRKNEAASIKTKTFYKAKTAKKTDKIDRNELDITKMKTIFKVSPPRERYKSFNAAKRPKKPKPDEIKNVKESAKKKAEKNKKEVISLIDDDDSDSVLEEEEGHDDESDNDDEEGFDDDYIEMTKDKTLIFSFFQEASVEDIASVPGCSEKNAAKIVDLRPFADYGDLVSKVSSLKGVQIRVIEESLDFINERAKVDKLMVKCQKISERIGKAIREQSSLKKDDDLAELEFKENKETAKQPSILNPSLTLKHYQLTGLNWLITLHKEGVNGILADQMGLGKTIQALAFIGYLIANGDPGPHVIIVPSSTSENWLREIDTWLPSVNYIHYKGSQEERFALREEILYGEEEFSLIISTYNIAISTPKDRSLFRKLKSHYLILDEGHMLKNMKSNRYKYLMEIQATRRLLLTGTPLQNNLLEMMSLLSFLMPDLFAERLDGITLIFGSKSKSEYQERIIETAKNILKPFILRRTKKNVLRDLPKKVEKVMHCELTQKQRLHYDAVIAKYKSLQVSTGSKADYNSALAALMQLRKLANHPLLERFWYDKELLTKMANDYVNQLENRECSFEYVLEDMEVMSDFELHSLCREKYYLNKYRLQTEAIISSGKFKQLDKLLPELKAKDSRVLLFSQFTMMLDIVEPYLKYNNHRYLRLDGKTPVSERQRLIDKYNDDDDIFIFLLSTKAGGVGINLTSANVVIMHDIDFNPYNDKQAEDRCHRVGQTREVTVYKLISKDSIEEGIFTCANNKLNLERNVTGNYEEEGEAMSDDVVEYLMENIS